MTVVVKLVSELFMITLCLLAGPASEKDMEKDILIDRIGARGYIDTMIAKRTDEGFVIYDEQNKEMVEVGRMRPLEGKEHVYVCTDAKGKKEVVNLPESIVDFKSMDLSKAKKDILELKGGPRIRLSRSRGVVYLTDMIQNQTRVVHIDR